MSDNRANLGIPAGDDSAGLSTSGNWNQYASAGVNTFSSVTNLIFAGAGSGGVMFNTNQNVGQMNGGTNGALSRGGSYNNNTLPGIFGGSLATSVNSPSVNNGFRCVFVP